MSEQYQNLNKEELLKLLQEKDFTISKLKEKITKTCNNDIPKVSTETNNEPKLELDLGSIKRFSRQLILPEFGPNGQKQLLSSKVLVVGCGGLGCPASLYLAAAGIGNLGLVDHDCVEESNLHRQVLHTESRLNQPKTTSAKTAIQALNSNVRVTCFNLSLDSTNALDIVRSHDIVLDCTDNVATRYLLNDACILTGKPLVSGAALRFEGQLTVYGHGPDALCYRCLFPVPPPANTVTNCSDGGVLGAVPGVIGVMQALETIKVLTGMGDVYAGRMLLFDALAGQIRNVRLRSRRSDCSVCGDEPSITSLIDYAQFCGTSASDKDAPPPSILDVSERISVTHLQELMLKENPFVLIDVRTPVELDICRLSWPTINIPPDQLSSSEAVERVTTATSLLKSRGLVVCICRRGNDSQRAVEALRGRVKDCDVCDVVGGLWAWAAKVDPKFPVY